VDVKRRKELNRPERQQRKQEDLEAKTKERSKFLPRLRPSIKREKIQFIAFNSPWGDNPKKTLQGQAQKTEGGQIPLWDSSARSVHWGKGKPKKTMVNHDQSPREAPYCSNTTI